MVILGGDDVLIGSGVDDKSKAKAEREATLASLGIKPLSPYSSPLMDTAQSKKPGRVTPRKTARAAGKTFYISDKRCPWNHNSRRYVSTGQCCACTYLSGEAVAAAKERAKHA